VDRPPVAGQLLVDVDLDRVEALQDRGGLAPTFRRGRRRAVAESVDTTRCGGRASPRRMAVARRGSSCPLHPCPSRGQSARSPRHRRRPAGGPGFRRRAGRTRRARQVVDVVIELRTRRAARACPPRGAPPPALGPGQHLLLPQRLREACASARGTSARSRRRDRTRGGVGVHAVHDERDEGHSLLRQRRWK